MCSLGVPLSNCICAFVHDSSHSLAHPGLTCMRTGLAVRRTSCRPVRPSQVSLIRCRPHPHPAYPSRPLDTFALTTSNSVTFVRWTLRLRWATRLVAIALVGWFCRRIWTTLVIVRTTPRRAGHVVTVLRFGTGAVASRVVYEVSGRRTPFTGLCGCLATCNGYPPLRTR